MANIVESQLDQARERLLDLSMRNRLLNFRPTRRTTIQIVDEIPAEIWKLLIERGKTMSFLAREEHEMFQEESDKSDKSDESDDDDGQLFALPDVSTAVDTDDAALPQRYTDLFLQTWLGGEVLQTNLLRTYQAANLALEERGVNLLFLAMGFLQWRDKNHPERDLKAPILLLPVRLDRTSARRRFKLSALDDEAILNPCLVAKLDREHHIALPQPPDDWAELDVEAFFQSVSQAVAGQAEWKVLPEMVLGLFSFAKYLMYVDLDASRWPAGRGLTENPLVRSMCGDDEAIRDDVDDLPDPARMDDQLPPQEVFQVLDADSSQQEAVLAAKRGKSLVIEGPPGTGKSQTITNIIAECLATGRTVLFVSEKMAALEVVKRRLDSVGLGDFCLELHSTKANRKAVVQELRKGLENSGRRTAGKADGAGKLVQLKGKLNAYVRALHDPLSPSGLTPYRAMGRIALLHDIPDLLCPIPGCDAWTEADLEEMKEKTRRLGRRMEAVWPVDRHPWRGARLRTCDAQTRRAVQDALSGLSAAVEGMQSATAELAAMLGAKPAATLRQIQRLREAAALVVAPPPVDGRLLEEDLWDDLSADAQLLLKRIKEASEIRESLRGRYTQQAEGAADWQAVAERFQKKYTSLLGRWIRPSYWSDRAVLKQAREGGYRPDFTRQTADLGELARLQSLAADLRAADEIGVRVLGAAWQGPQTHWPPIETLAGWLTAFRKLVKSGVIGVEGIALAAGDADRDELSTAADLLRRHVDAWAEHWAALTKTVALAEPEALEYPVAATDLPALATRLAEMADAAESLVDWAQYQDALQTCEASPLAELIRRALADAVEPDVLALAVEKQFLRLLMKDALARREALARFNSADHEADRLAFAKLDARWVGRSGDRLRDRLAAEMPSAQLSAARSSQLGILQGEVRRVRGGRTIRRLLRDAADAVQKLKPCLMMSPLSVAQFIDPHGMRFDVVVFDEASQVEPADAVGAVARGSQLLLVGDPKQLPPTSFFDSMSGEGARVETDTAAGLADMESILDRGSMVLPCLRLRWHYRSRHESLIAFSNGEFYDGSLVVFPSSHSDTSQLGLSMRYEPDDRYGRGRSQANPDQARRIAEWVFDHARRLPDRTVGVGAFSQRQQQAVLDEIEKLRRQDESLEAFFDRNKPEPFFVKNLETIQGDERDVILLSVGYGKSGPDERLSMNFGPLNQEKGWRRLNVLITRARERCVVFSAIRAEDFDLTATPALGVHALKRYLEYALSGRVPRAEVGGDDEFESAFEQAVHDALAAEGVTLHRRVGFAASAIDLAVVDPDRPGRYVLGIECDGGSYRRCATARDRDRLRQQVLEGLGWRIHRIWSADWFRTPRKELDRALAAVDAARRGQLQPSFVGLTPKRGKPPEPPPREEAPPPAPADLPPIPTRPYTGYVDDEHRTTEDYYVAPLDALAGIIDRIVACEGPIHEGELARRMAAVWGMNRIGTRVQKRFDEALQVAATKGKVRRQGDFLWPPEMTDPPLRRRAEGGPRDIDLICLEEIALSARGLLAAQFGMNRPDLTTQVARVFGFSKTGSRIAERVDQSIQAEIDAGRITADDTGLLKAEENKPDDS